MEIKPVNNYNLKTQYSSRANAFEDFLYIYECNYLQMFIIMNVCLWVVYISCATINENRT